MMNQTLVYSLKNHKVISIIYIKEMEITQRKIQVLKMNAENITALDLDKKGIRTFRIENILSAMDDKILDQEVYPYMDTSQKNEHHREH